MITLLITGVGGPLGQALIKAARKATISCLLVGVDRNALSVGFDWVESPHVIADAGDARTYFSHVRRICLDEGVDLILPGSDAELLLLSSNAPLLREETGAIVVASPPDVLRIGLDKWETAQFLRRSGLNFPRTSLLSEMAGVEKLVSELGFPLVAKPCSGSGSRGFVHVRSWEDIRYLQSLGRPFVVQEYLQPDDQEYTVGVYTRRDGQQVGSICLKRELCGGNTYRAFVDQNGHICAEAEAIARVLRPRGPCNVQLRLTKRGAVAFEINPRFSGTTAIRANFGYNCVELAVREYVLGEEVTAPAIRRGIALRYWDESYLGEQARPELSVAAPAAAALRVFSSSQRESWIGVLQRARQHDFYFLPEYHALAERREEGEARLFVYEHAGYLIALPLIIRTLADHTPIGTAANTWRDATSVYGYSGPLYSHQDMPCAVVRGFQRALTMALQELHVVSVFSRLHPLMPAQTTLLEGLGDHQLDGATVSIDLSAAPVEQRAQYDGATKNRINRLLRSGATCVLDVEQRHLPEFIALYHETMRRVKAEQSYFFDQTYFSDLAKSLGRALKLFVVKMPDGQVISGGLFTLCDGIVQYHLGGTRDSALKLSPMMLIYETVRQWANENGAHTFHLGGGVGAKNDSLFQFKARFSRQRHQFFTWRWIVAPEAYRELSLLRDIWNSEHGLRAISASFFPAYRCRAESDATSAELDTTPGQAVPEDIFS
jgi:carbamoyl-phosphate synthase large subunit